MTAAELEALYSANAPIGHLEACEGVFLAGFAAGSGTADREPSRHAGRHSRTRGCAL